MKAHGAWSMEHGVKRACAPHAPTSCSLLPAPRSTPRAGQGYILLELVIALTIFAIAVLGLARSLSTALEVANSLNRENAIRIGLRSFLEEARRKKTTAEMAMTTPDDRLGCTYSSIIEDAGLQNKDGKNLADLYKLTAKATLPGVTDEQQPEPVTVYVYQPQTSSR